LRAVSLEFEKIAIAGVFHDLGIWTNKTFDYIAPSVVLAREYLAARGMGPDRRRCRLKPGF
jgi:hypothetical protein